MKYVLFFITGFILGFITIYLINLLYKRKRCQRIKRRQQKVRENTESKFSATKAIIFSILFTYYIAFAIGVWVVAVKDIYQLSVLLTFVGSVTVFAVAFYCWKAKAENLLKIKAAHPELMGTLSDFSALSSQ